MSFSIVSYSYSNSYADGFTPEYEYINEVETSEGTLRVCSVNVKDPRVPKVQQYVSGI